MNRLASLLTILGLFASLATNTSAQDEVPNWTYLSALPDAPNGRYDDLDFVSPTTGWVVNLDGQIWHTEDGGKSWLLQLERPKTKWRSVAFLDNQSSSGQETGWAGTVISRQSVLWETRDGGEHWDDITHRIEGVVPAGICGMTTYGDSAWGVGVFSGSPTLVRTTDGGRHWKGEDMSHLAGTLVDVYFHNDMVGFAVGGSGEHLNGDAIVLRTENGGKSWSKVFQSQRHAGVGGEWGWKISFPTPLVGYVSVEYRSNLNSNEAKILKTVNGGRTWNELSVRGSRSNLGLQGLGFISADIGWASGRGITSFTMDGGLTWKQLVDYDPESEMGQLDAAMNRFMSVNNTLAYGVGLRMYQLSGYGAQQIHDEQEPLPEVFTLDSAFPNPFTETTTLKYKLEKPARVRFRVLDPAGRLHRTYPARVEDPGQHEFKWDGRNDLGQQLASGNYMFLIDIGSSIEMKQVVFLK